MSWRPNPPTPTRRWKMFVNVSPADADVHLAFDGKNWPAGPGGMPQREINFSTPSCPPNAEGILTVERPGYVTQHVNVPDIGPPTKTFDVTLEADVPDLPDLAVDGAFFSAGGQRWTAVECSDFKLYQRYLTEGVTAIRPVLAQRQAYGFNMVRVFGMCRLMWDFNPADFPGFYSSLKPFVMLCASYGLYVEFTVFPDCVHVMPVLADQLNHWQRIGEALHDVPWWVLVELQNEADQTPNLIQSQAFSPLPDLICSHGSNGSQAIPVRPWWQYETFHTNDAFEWWRKGGHNGMELSEGADQLPASHVPILTNENTRPDRDPAVRHHEDAARACRLLVAGSCFHSNSGKTSDLWSDEDRPFALAFITGATDASVGLEYQVGHYQHNAAWEGPEDLRVYRRVLGNGAYAEVRIRK